jgi:hypothetical protein
MLWSRLAWVTGRLLGGLNAGRISVAVPALGGLLLAWLSRSRPAAAL